MTSTHLPTTMKAAVMHEPGKIVIEEHPIPVIGLDEALIKVMAVGVCGNIPYIADNELDIYGISRYANTYPSGIEFLASGLVDVKALITDEYPLEQSQEALERALHNKSSSLKVMVYPNA